MRLVLRRLRRVFSVRPAVRRPSSFRPTLERFEDRRVLSGNVLQTNLVSDLQGVAQHFDPNLVNPWGISSSPTTPTAKGSPFWVSDNNAGVSTLYDSTGNLQSLVVSIPAPGDPLGASGTPTGTVFNLDLGGGAFKVSGVAKDGTTPASAPAIFLFVTEDGTIVGWNPGVNPNGFDPTKEKPGTFGIIAVDNSGNNFTEPDPAKQTGAVYKGLAIATSSSPIFSGDSASNAVIYAANFRSGQIEVYEPNPNPPFFKPVTLPKGAFSDPNLPKDYAPFNVQVLNGKLYVTYAKQDKTKHDDDAGPHRGFVDVFNLDGTPGLSGGNMRLVSRGPLDSPWGLAIAPTGFAGLTAPNGDPVLLVGNFGNGFINAFDATTGDFLGRLKDPDGEPIQIDGLWALRVGNGGNGGDPNTVYFTAGLFHESHGLFGSLSTATPGSPEEPAEGQMVQAALDVFQMALTKLQGDIASGAPKDTIRQDLQDLHTALVDLVHAEARFADDVRDDAGLGGHKGEDSSHGPDLGDRDDIFAAGHWKQA
jgi:uncharacterized protein (TIGR03118 family)